VSTGLRIVALPTDNTMQYIRTRFKTEDTVDKLQASGTAAIEIDNI
jgi:hypothetical protein